MTFYITSEPQHRLKHAFKNIKQYKIIDVDFIFAQCDLDADNNIHGFIIDQEISRMIKEGSNQKKFAGVIYVYSKLSGEVIEKIKDVVYSIESEDTVDIILMDDYDVPKLKHLYHHADHVMFFPTIKKTKVIKCKPIKQPKQ